MTLSLLFWMIYIITMLFGLWANYTPGQPFGIRPFGQFFVSWVLIGILGWAQFGAAIHR